MIVASTGDKAVNFSRETQRSKYASTNTQISADLHKIFKVDIRSGSLLET